MTPIWRPQRRTVTAPALVLLLLAGCARTPLETRTVAGGTLSTLHAVEDRFEALQDPAFLPAAAAAEHMREREPVLGFHVGRQPVAVALRVLDDHEIVNGRLGSDPEQAFAATW